MSNDGLKMHIIELKHKHHLLEQKISDLMNSHIDELEIQELKKQKLYLKDEITKFEAQLG